MNTANQTITVKTSILASLEHVWHIWTSPSHIVKWNAASDDWHTTKAENDVRVGGSSFSRMEAKDGSFGFDFRATYTEVSRLKQLNSTLEDGRKVWVTFEFDGTQTHLSQVFEPESENTLELQQFGWQAILNNFKKYTESRQVISYQIAINAPVEHVYKCMIAEDTYKSWTAVFNPTSYYQGSWDKGAAIKFLGTDENGDTGGMISRIAENRLNQFISIEHLGMILKGVEITSGPEVEQWAGGLENYTFETINNQTVVTATLDSNEEFAAYFAETWPNALAKLKQICEN